MKTLEEIKDEVAFEKENCKWNCLFMVDQWNYSEEVAKRYATEAIKADRERVAENAKTKYVRYDDPKANFHGEDVVDKESILNLPIELP